MLLAGISKHDYKSRRGLLLKKKKNAEEKQFISTWSLLRPH